MATDVTATIEFVVGSLVRLTTTVKQDGQAVDPATVAIIIDEPDGATINKSLVDDVQHPALGSFYFDYDADKPGIVQYRWKTANPKGAQENYIVVTPSRVATP